MLSSSPHLASRPIRLRQSPEANAAGARHLVADSETEKNGWVTAVQRALDGIKAASEPPAVRSHEALAEQLKKGFQTLSASASTSTGARQELHVCNRHACLSTFDHCEMNRCHVWCRGLCDAGRTVEVSNYGGGSGYGSSGGGRRQESYDSYYGQPQPVASQGGGGYSTGGGGGGGGYGAQPQAQQQRYSEPPRATGTWEVRS